MFKSFDKFVFIATTLESLLYQLPPASPVLPNVKEDCPMQKIFDPVIVPALLIVISPVPAIMLEALPKVISPL